MHATQLHSNDLHRVFKRAGLVLTPHRHAVLHALAQAGPISIAGLRRALGSGSPHRVTLYRVVEQLEAAGLVKRLRFRHEDEDRFELGETLHRHHHHLVCESCGLTRGVLAEPARPKLPRGFKLLGHQLEFYGLCASCRRSAA